MTRIPTTWAIPIAGILIFALHACPLLAADKTTEAAQAALRQATRFFTTQVAAHGGYLFRYSADLSFREGEGDLTQCPSALGDATLRERLAKFREAQSSAVPERPE